MKNAGDNRPHVLTAASRPTWQNWKRLRFHFNGFWSLSQSLSSFGLPRYISTFSSPILLPKSYFVFSKNLTFLLQIHRSEQALYFIFFRFNPIFCSVFFSIPKTRLLQLANKPLFINETNPMYNGWSFSSARYSLRLLHASPVWPW